MKYPEIAKKINTLREYIDNLRPYTSIRAEDLLGNQEKILAMERLFQLMVDEAADINAYVAFQVTNVVPESYRSSFSALADAKIMDRELVDALADSARVRNQIVHDYEKMQKRESIALINKFFPLYEKYAQALIKEFVEKSAG